VTFGQLYAIQPFNNTLITLTLTGAQIAEVIEDGLDDQGPKQILAPSANVRFTYDLTRPARSRIVSLTLDGKPIDPAANYRVTTNNFLANGGDGFASFTKGTQQEVGATDIDAFAAWISAVPMRQVPQEMRAVPVGQ